jgi:hypothetical protein
MKWAATWAIFIIAGIMFFLNVDTEKEMYWMPYFLWDKGKDIIASIAFVCLFKKYKYLYLPILIFLIIRFLWEPVSSIFHLSINNRIAGNVLFGLLILVILITYLKEQSKWQK